MSVKEKGFIKYTHVERFGTEEVEGIEHGICLIQSKLDGSNGSVWLYDGEVVAASRNRVLTLENDNQGFFAHILQQQNIIDYVNKYPDHILRGEWLKPHTLRTYRDSAWNKFYVFDVEKRIDDEGNTEFIPYEIYNKLLTEFNINFIPLMAEIKNPTKEQLYAKLEQNTYLIQDGAGCGEGITIKNPSYRNYFGRKAVAKIVRSEFKEANALVFGHAKQEGKLEVEQRIIDIYCTQALIEKTKAKIENAEGGWRSQYIPRLLETVYHDLVKEDIWTAIKKFKGPIINFKILKALCDQKIKQVVPKIFS